MPHHHVVRLSCGRHRLLPLALLSCAPATRKETLSLWQRRRDECNRQAHSSSLPVYTLLCSVSCADAVVVCGVAFCLRLVVIAVSLAQLLEIASQTGTVPCSLPLHGLIGPSSRSVASRVFAGISANSPGRDLPSGSSTSVLLPIEAQTKPASICAFLAPRCATAQCLRQHLRAPGTVAGRGVSDVSSLVRMQGTSNTA